MKEAILGFGNLVKRFEIFWKIGVFVICGFFVSVYSWVCEIWM